MKTIGVEIYHHLPSSLRNIIIRPFPLMSFIKKFLKLRRPVKLYFLYFK